MILKLIIIISLSAPDANSSLHQLRNCLHDVCYWLTENRSTVNADKTEFLIVGPQRHRNKIKNGFVIWDVVVSICLYILQ